MQRTYSQIEEQKRGTQEKMRKEYEGQIRELTRDWEAKLKATQDALKQERAAKEECQEEVQKLRKEKLAAEVDYKSHAEEEKRNLS